MKEFTIYDKTSGAIRRFGSCADADFPIQAGAGEDVIEGRFPDDAFWVVDGKPVAIPPAPDQWSEYDHIAGQWVDRRSLDDLRDAARREVLAEVNAAVAPIFAGYPAHEAASFAGKLAAARQVVAGLSDPEIEAEAAARGMTSQEMAERIIAKGEPAARKMRAIDGHRGKAFAAIRDAQDAREIAAAVAETIRHFKELTA